MPAGLTSAVCFENQSAYATEYVDLDGIDAVWLRLDLADELFLQYVEQRFAGRFISNNPAGVVRSGTKAFLLGLAPVMDDLMPAVKLCYKLLMWHVSVRRALILFSKYCAVSAGRALSACAKAERLTSTGKPKSLLS